MISRDAMERVRSSVPRETFELLVQLAEMVTHENAIQNLIAKSTEGDIWQRHILDSAQLVGLAPESGIWLDIGSGGGFPGLVVGVMRQAPTTLAEPRAKRAAFLRTAVEKLGISDRVHVAQARVERIALPSSAAVISARAVAALPNLLAMAEAHATEETLWLLPKGRSAASEVAEAQREWQGAFRLVPSLSDPDSAIVVAQGVRRKTRR